MLKKIFILFLALLPSCQLFSQDLEFYKEDLFFEIKNHCFYVKGIYYFSNVSNNNIVKPIFYPFPINKTEYGIVDSIIIKDINANITVPFKKDSLGVLFYLKLDAYQTTKYQISYQQNLLSNTAEYILLTTKNWGKPFEQARYQLTLSDCKINSFSITPDSSSFSNHKSLYFWNKHNYMPDSNMVFHLNYPNTK